MGTRTPMARKQQRESSRPLQRLTKCCGIQTSAQLMTNLENRAPIARPAVALMTGNNGQVPERVALLLHFRCTAQMLRTYTTFSTFSPVGAVSLSSKLQEAQECSSRACRKETSSACQEVSLQRGRQASGARRTEPPSQSMLCPSARR